MGGWLRMWEGDAYCLSERARTERESSPCTARPPEQSTIRGGRAKGSFSVELLELDWLREALPAPPTAPLAVQRRPLLERRRRRRTRSSHGRSSSPIRLESDGLNFVTYHWRHRRVQWLFGVCAPLVLCFLSPTATGFIYYLLLLYAVIALLVWTFGPFLFNALIALPLRSLYSSSASPSSTLLIPHPHHHHCHLSWFNSFKLSNCADTNWIQYWIKKKGKRQGQNMEPYPSPTKLDLGSNSLDQSPPQSGGSSHAEMKRKTCNSNNTSSHQHHQQQQHQQQQQQQQQQQHQQQQQQQHSLAGLSSGDLSSLYALGMLSITVDPFLCLWTFLISLI